MTTVSKSRFKAQAFELFREVERTGKPIIITDHGNPVLRLSPYIEGPRTAMMALRGSVVRYDAPTRPIGAAGWEQGR